MIIVITSPGTLPGESATCNAMLERGLLALHLRKPGATRETLETFIREISPAYRRRIVVHDHFDLVDRFGLKGIHVNARGLPPGEVLARFEHASLSCHSLQEIIDADALPWRPAYLFLGPLFDSISKPNYTRATFDEEQLRATLRATRQRVIALGGITASNIAGCRALGFAGGALLGHLWQQPAEALDRFTRVPPPPVLLIAGLDPTAGAGLSSDIKTIEALHARGIGACSAITYQNQHAYTATTWITPARITRQCEVLLEEFTPAVVKIGIMESLPALLQVATYLRERLPAAFIIWDPVMKTSTGHTLHERVDRETCPAILDKIDLVTPNADEWTRLFDNEETARAACRAHRVAILRKGGHLPGNAASDSLLLPGGDTREYSVARLPGEKHGTGCVLSATIAALLARGHALPDACREAQRHVARFILSSPTLLGRHDIPARVSPRASPLRFIPDPREPTTLPEQVNAACSGGTRWVQFRVKEGSIDEILLAGMATRQVCRQHGAIFIINDRVALALALDADGVHLGKEDMNITDARRLLGYHKIIGATCNTIDDVIESARQGADYIGLGPFARTTTKHPLAPLLGLDGYRRVLAAARAAGITTPVYAIGGIRLEDIDPLLQTGIAGIAVSSLINDSTNPRATARLIHTRLCSYR